MLEAKCESARISESLSLILEHGRAQEYVGSTDNRKEQLCVVEEHYNYDDAASGFHALGI